MLLLLLHLLQYGLLLELDQVPPLSLAEAQPKVLDTFALLLARITPESVLLLCRGGGGGRGSIGRRYGSGFVGGACWVRCGGSRGRRAVRPHWIGGGGSRRRWVGVVHGLLARCP